MYFNHEEKFIYILMTKTSQIMRHFRTLKFSYKTSLSALKFLILGSPVIQHIRVLGRQFLCC
jgi:hypothetical protein